MPAPKYWPETLRQFWSDNPTEYTKDDIHHSEPDSQISHLLKYLLENGFAKLTIKLNGEVIGEYNGGEPFDLDIALGTLTVQRNGTNIGTYNGSNNITVNVVLGNLNIQKNGTTVATYNGDSNATANITVPVITHGTAAPSSGAPGDYYVRYLA